jgi:RHS repeat-associated protein
VGPISEHTNARPHCSFQLGTTTQYGTTWLSVASSTDETGTVVQTLDYYPYGATRISGGQNATSRKYIGQFADQSALSYFNARYYDSSRGQFLSEDPIFLQLGSREAEKLAKRSLQQILSDPQGLNSYSYAEDNPISIKDPSGLMSQKTQATLDAIVPLLGQLVNLLSQIVVQLGGGGSASTAMLARSTTLNPGPLNITPGNQQTYGNVINKIEKSKDFTNYVDDQIKKNGKNGTLNVPVNDPNYSFTFNQGDLKTALHNVNGGLSGKQSPDGSWNIRVNIQDTYNFEPNRYGSGYSSNAVSTLNNAAVAGQAAGVVSPYPVNISFNYAYKPQ